MTAATVTVYVHIRHKEPIVTPLRHVEFASGVAGPAATPEGDIVVAPFSGGAVGQRWGAPDASSQSASAPPRH